MVCISEAQIGKTAGLTATQRLAALPPRQTISYRNGRLTYREAGSGPTLVLLHGLLGSADSWVWQMQDLAARYHVVAWDAPGYGGSDAVEADLDTFADALDTLLRHLNTKDVTVLGHSMGGVISTYTATRPGTPINRLILSCTHGGYAEDPNSPPTQKLLQRMKDLEILGGEAYGRSRAEGMVTPSASPDVIDLAARIAAQTRPQGLFNATRALQLADARPLYARLTIPTLVIFGAEDQVVRPELSEELRRLTPFAQHVVLPGVGHAPYLEDPAAYTGAITAFLETHAHAES